MQSFSDWLHREIESSRMALIQLYESRDRILYVDAQSLRQKYMDLIGIHEEPVLQAELEVALLRRKIELIQIAVNRREPIRLAEIDAQLEEEKQREMARLESADLTLDARPALTDQQEHDLQRQYREITRSFHPAVNPSITDTQKELYEKAMEAYRMQNPDEMKIIYDCLFSPGNLIDISIKTIVGGQQSPEERQEEYRALVADLSTDYSLAKALYDCFVPLEEDRVVLDALREYKAQRRRLEDEIAAIRAGFPFNAVETMNDPAKTKAYLAELRIRARHCESDKAELTGRITRMTEGKPNA